MNLDNPVSVAFEVDTERRTIKGLALPFGDVAESNGLKWTFGKGSLTWSKVKVLDGHDWSRAVGTAELMETDEGLLMTARIARGPRGDEVLTLAEDGVYDGLSIGLAEDVKTTVRDGVHHAQSGTVREVSLTPIPAFARASVTSVAASAAPTTEGTTMTEQVEAGPEPVNLDAVTDAIKAGFASLTSEGPAFVSPTAGPAFVNEAPLYRFDGVRGDYDFSTDLIAYGRDRDAEAGQRVMRFMAETFAPRFDVDTANVATLNPSRNRPDMYVDERRFRTPLYDALYKGSIADQTPFLFPKFNSASGLVADHVEGVEPTPGSFTATNQTVTPSAMSGKVEITREVWDQGGNPQVSGLIYSKMVQHYFSALEVKAYNLLTAASPTGIPITAGLADDDLVNAVEDAIVDLNFIAGGNTFDYAATHANLYKKLASAVDGTGRKLLPQIGATNSNGQSRSKFVSLDVAGVEFTPVPSLGAASSAVGSSYLIDTSCVHVWNTTPTRLDFDYRVAYVDLAIFGYVATAISDINGVREITFDPVA